MSVIAIILLILLGILLLMVEFLVIPGITIAGIGGFLLISGGIFCGYYFHSTTVGNYILLGTGVSTMAIFITALKIKTWRRFGLKSTVEGKVGLIDVVAIQPGVVGKTVSKLSPIGKAMIDGKMLEVRSDGTYIDSDRDIIITRIEGNKIYVDINFI